MPDARRLYLHVGLQKTGTSYLQAAMLGSSRSLAEQGLDLVPPTKRECFELMVVIRNRYAARRDPDSDRNTIDRFTAPAGRRAGLAGRLQPGVPRGRWSRPDRALARGVR